MNARIAVMLSCVLLGAAPAAAADDIGRYTIRDVTVALPSPTGDLPRVTVLLDTATGRTWMLANPADGNLAWGALSFNDSGILVDLPPKLDNRQ